MRGDLESVFADGLSLTARSWPYRPPNPDAYAYVVDGRCDFRLELGSAVVTGSTNFRRGAEWAKRRVVRGVGDGRPFTIEGDFLEGRKRLRINGQSHDDVTATDSYAEVVATYGRWYQEIPREALLTGLYPNPAFAFVTYQLSSLLWRSCWDRAPLALGSLAALQSFDARYAAAVPCFSRYGPSGPPCNDQARNGQYTHRIPSPTRYRVTHAVSSSIIASSIAAPCIAAPSNPPRTQGGRGGAALHRTYHQFLPRMCRTVSGGNAPRYVRNRRSVVEMTMRNAIEWRAAENGRLIRVGAWFNVHNVQIQQEGVDRNVAKR